MKRVRYLVAYDIREQRRLRAVHRVMLSHGSSLQYSVFICDLNYNELCSLRSQLRDVAELNEDSIVIIPLGEAYDDRRIEFLGRRVRLPTDEPLVF